MATRGDITYFHIIGRILLDQKSWESIYWDWPDFFPPFDNLAGFEGVAGRNRMPFQGMMGERMPLRCPSCDIQLIELGSEIDVFRCPVENITWKLSKRDDGRYLEKVYAQPGYRGPTTVKIDKVLDK